MPSAVWSGEELIVWGGDALSGDVTLSSGARYDPKTDTWSPTAQDIGNVSGRSRHIALWAGSQMLVWGGYPYGYQGEPEPGALYSPASDSWMVIQPGEYMAEDRLSGQSVIFTGSEMIAWGGHFNGPTGFGGIYAILPEDIEMEAVAEPAAGAAPLSVAFDADASPVGCADEPATAWTFGDGATSLERSPAHIYWTPGEYTWTAAVSVNGVLREQSGTIVVVEPPCGGIACAAAAEPASGAAPLEVSFAASIDSGACTGPVSYRWDFGDGGTATDPALNHSYARPGTYRWTMDAEVDGAVCSREGTVAVSCNPPVVAAVKKLGDPFRLRVDIVLPLTGDWTVYLAGQDTPWPFVKAKNAQRFVIKKAKSLFKKDGSETTIEIVNGDGCAATIAYNRRDKTWRVLGKAMEVMP